MSPNRLATEASPYLQQHKDNPVDWYPWGEEALAEAKKRGVPILVSIGYSTCHWCHVMAHESFENESIARLMNDNFVNIKVDREERPDIDAIYMQATQMLGYQTGWPLNVVLTPDGLPFFGGTYFPPTPRQGMPGFGQVLMSIRDLWQRDRAKVIRGGQEVARHLITAAEAYPEPRGLNAGDLQAVMRALFEKFDKRHGGFGDAPKFPQAPVLDFLLRHYARTGDVAALSMVEITLGAMAEGGIHDQLGGGFARYSVDKEWQVPHFEKMLYDNAMLLPIYVDTYRFTDEPVFRDVATGIVTWLEREMLLSGGGFAAALDADSEGAEGTYYVWTEQEIDDLFADGDREVAKRHFGISADGNFDGANVLNIVETWEDMAEDLSVRPEQMRNQLQSIRNRMFKARDGRVRPHQDTKVIAAWNGMAIHALASSGLALNEPHWIDLARNAARFLLDQMIGSDGTLARSWAGKASVTRGVLEDYAHTARGLISLYFATGEQEWLDTAWNLMQTAQDRFAHESGIGYYDTPSDTDLFTRPRELTDSALPSGNAVMAEVLLMFGAMRRSEELTAHGQRIVEAMASVMARHPQHLGAMASAAERLLAPPREIVLSGQHTGSLREAAARRVDPLMIWGYVTRDSDSKSDWGLLTDKPFTSEPTAYWCTNFTCQAPTSDPETLRASMM